MLDYQIEYLRKDLPAKIVLNQDEFLVNTHFESLLVHPCSMLPLMNDLP